MGGIGKTTLAAKLFNSLLPDFGDATCFLANVRSETNYAGGLVKLQEDFLNALTGSRIVVKDVDSGAARLHQTSASKYIIACQTYEGRPSPCPVLEYYAMFRPVDGTLQAAAWLLCLCCCAGRGTLVTQLKLRKVLVVIDDTDDESQLESLLPQCELHPESIVIITSRNKIVLDARCISVREVQVLPEGRDVQLLEAWAFEAGPPDWDTSELIQGMVKCCGGLPLTLKVGNSTSSTFVLQAHI